MVPLFFVLIFVAGITELPGVCLAQEEGLRCYHCGIGSAEDVTCDHFQQLPRWAPFEVTCSSDTYCLKSINEGKVGRGCSAKRDSLGKPHTIGCHQASMHQSSTTICFCDTKLCNSASTLDLPIVFKLLILIYVRYQVV